MTKCHKLGGRNNRNVFSHSSRGWYSNIKVLANSVPGEIPGEGSLSGRQMAAFLCTCTQTPHTFTEREREREVSGVSSSKGIHLTGQRSQLHDFI